VKTLTRQDSLIDASDVAGVQWKRYGTIRFRLHREESHYCTVLSVHFNIVISKGGMLKEGKKRTLTDSTVTVVNVIVPVRLQRQTGVMLFSGSRREGRRGRTPPRDSESALKKSPKFFRPFWTLCSLSKQGSNTLLATFRLLQEYETAYHEENRRPMTRLSPVAQVVPTFSW
jgi:hypothetical protein